jgi:hypothetical protein
MAQLLQQGMGEFYCDKLCVLVSRLISVLKSFSSAVFSTCSSAIKLGSKLNFEHGTFKF